MRRDETARDGGRSPNRRLGLGFAIVALMIGVLAVLILLPNNAAYVWFFAAEGLLFLTAAPLVAGRPRVLAVNAGGVLIVLLGFELYYQALAAREPVEWFSGGYRLGYHEWRHPILGYRPTPDNAATSARHVDGERIYRVTYTIGKDALRVAPPDLGDRVKGSLIFFGGSFTFGEGVEDRETLPYRVGLLTDGRYAVRNFGFHGYGPHQMLAALESGYVRERVSAPVRLAVYVGLPYHDRRVLGSRWDTTGPRYVLDENGRPFLAGRFSDCREAPDPLGNWIRYRVLCSRLGRALLARFDPKDRFAPDLYLAIVAAAGRAVEREFPGSEFHVIFWDLWPEGPDYAEALTKRGLRVHRVTEIIPDIGDHPERYWVHPLDQHPNAKALDAVARYVVRRILREKDS